MFDKMENAIGNLRRIPLGFPDLATFSLKAWCDNLYIQIKFWKSNENLNSPNVWEKKESNI